MQPKSLNIALDFDDTYTAMPAIWDMFITACKAAGHCVTIVTARSSKVDCESSWNDDIIEVTKKHKIQVIYTDGNHKAYYFDADIWIDDNPHWIPKKSLMLEYIELFKEEEESGNLNRNFDYPD